MTNMIHGTRRIVVIREVNPEDNTNLHEFWELPWSAWNDEEVPDDQVLECHVAPWTGGNINESGIPRSGKRATGTCWWSEAPTEVREAMREEVKTILDAIDHLDHS